MTEIKYKNKKGMSLIEMMVAISIFTIGIAGFTTLFYRSWKANSFIIEEGVASSQASRTVTSIAGKIRETRQSDTGEYMIKTANDFDLVVYNNEDDDTDVERVHYYLDDVNHILKRGIAEASGSPLKYPDDYSSDTVDNVASYVMNDAAQPIFKYYNNDNVQITTPATPTDIKVVEINLWINIRPASAPDNVIFSTMAEIRNLDESI